MVRPSRARSGAAIRGLLDATARRGWWKTERQRLTQLTFRSGALSAVRFSHDGQTIIHSTGHSRTLFHGLGNHPS